MKLRNVWLLILVVAIGACGGAAEEPVADTVEPEPVADVPMDDGAVLDELTEYFVTHYNMGHADMVAELYADDAVFLAADGSVHDGRPAIQASMETAMASDPVLNLDVAERVITGDYAVSHGVWGLEMTPEGAPAALVLDGHFMTLHGKMGEEWKTVVVLTNYHADPPEGTPVGEPPAEAPTELSGSILEELADYYATHFSMGHGDMVASRYAEDGMAAFANQPVSQGRAAIAANLNTRMEEGGNPQLTIHEVAAEELGDGWVLGAGWYELAASAGGTQGSYLMLCRPDADGNMEIHWAVSNGQPVPQ